MARVERCPDCPFGPKGPAVGPRGNPKGKLVFIAESPGKEEVRAGEMLVGPSGELLEKTSPIPLDHPDVFMTNACKCAPGRKKDQNKLKRAVAICRPRLLAELEEAPREVIIAMGGGALWAVTGDFNLKPTQERGKIIESPLATAGIATTVHPAFLLRGGGSYRQFKEDIERGCNLIQGIRQEPNISSDYIIADYPDLIRFWVRKLSRAELVVADIETTGFDRQSDRIIALGCIKRIGATIIFPRSVFKNLIMRDLLRPLFRAPNPKWIWHNGKFDIAFLRREGLEARVDGDTMLLSYARDENKGMHDLEQLGNDVIGLSQYKHMLDPWVKKGGSHWKEGNTYEDVPPDILHYYLALDCSSTLQVHEELEPKIIADKHLNKLYTKTLIPSSEFFSATEKRGLLVDPEALLSRGTTLARDRELKRNEIQKIAGYDINCNSWQQLSKLMYDELKIPKYKGRINTDKDTLEKLRPHPVVKALQKYRFAQKYYSTYIVGIEREIKADGRVHPTILIHGTNTGRPSSREPNVLNIPRDPLTRGIFRAPPGYVLLDFDLDQAELRVLAMLSGDDFLRSIYLEGRKLHKEVATELFGPNYSQDQYMQAKAVNFGIPYGREAASLAEEFGLSVAAGQQWINDWFALAPKAKIFLDKCAAAPTTGKSMITTFGQKRRFGVVSKEGLHHTKNQARNFFMQSISNHIALHTGMKARLRLEAEDIWLNNFVYDSLVMECPALQSKVDFAEELITRCLDEVVDEWLTTDIRFTMSKKITTHWGNPATEVELEAA